VTQLIFGRKRDDMQDNAKHVRQALILIAQTLMFLVVAISTWSAWQTHEQTLFFASAWGAAIVAFIGFVGVAAHSIRHRRLPEPVSLGLVLVGGLGGAAVVMVYLALGLSAYDAYRFISASALSDTTTVLLVAFATLLSGVALFFFRLKRRCAYGLSETMVGLVVASQKFRADALAPSGQTPTTLMVLAILTAGVYLVVRGLDNIHQGLTKPPLDPWAQKVIGWLSAIGKKDAELGLSISVKITREGDAEAAAGKAEMPARETGIWPPRRHSVVADGRQA
jgi:hypothetical protein